MKLFETALGVDIRLVLEAFSNVRTNAIKNRMSQCPICGNGTRTGCFGLYGQHKGELDRFKCFSCNASGDAVELVAQIKKCDRTTAAREICDRFHIEYDNGEEKPHDEAYNRYTAIYNYVANIFNYVYNKKKDGYFEKRGLSSQTINKYRLGFCPKYVQTEKGQKTINEIVCAKFGKVDINFDMFANRYVFPIYNTKGDVVAFAGRTLNSDAPKYINSPNTAFFNKSYVLFNYNVAHKYPTIIAVEGYMDALALIGAGIPNVVATMGTALTSRHLHTLAGKQIVLAFDNDEAGRNNLAKIIIENPKIKFLVHKFLNNDFKDFSEELEKTKGVAINPVPAIDWLIGYLITKYNPKDLEGRIQTWTIISKILGNKVRKNTYPINEVYSEPEYDYYWVKINRLFKGRRYKNETN